LAKQAQINDNILKVLYLTGPLTSKELILSMQGLRKRTFFNTAMATMKKYSIEVDYLTLKSWGRMREIVQAIKALIVRDYYDIILTTTGTGLFLALVRFLLRWKKPYLFLIEWQVERNPILDLFLIPIFRNIDKIICVSSVQEKSFAKTLNVSINRIRYVPLGIDIDFFRPETDIISASDIILCVGDADRDDETLFKAVRNLPVKLIRVSDEFKVFQFYKVLLKDCLKPPILKAKFELLHAVSDLEMRELYAKSTLIIVPILKHSNQPAGLTVLLEAMAMGKPVIVTKGLITEDYVINGDTGIIINPDDANELKRMILELLDEDIKRKKLGNNARKFVEDNFTITKSTEELANILMQNACRNKKSILL